MNWEELLVVPVSMISGKEEKLTRDVYGPGMYIAHCSPVDSALGKEPKDNLG